MTAITKQAREQQSKTAHNPLKCFESREVTLLAFDCRNWEKTGNDAPPGHPAKIAKCCPVRWEIARELVPYEAAVARMEREVEAIARDAPRNWCG